MFFSLILVLAGAGLVASAALNGVELLVVFGATWGRVVIALLGAELLFLGGRAIVRSGNRRKLLEMTPEQRTEEIRARMPGARVRAVFAAAAGIGLAVLGMHDEISGEAIRLTGAGSVLFVVLGIILGIVALLLALPHSLKLDQAYAGRKSAATAAAPARRDPCLVCGSANVCYGVSLRGGDGGVWAYYDRFRLEEMVGDICRACGGVRFRVRTPDRNWKDAV
jgi:hypothetical protein